MRKFFVAYLAAFITMLLLDGLWLGLVAMPVYQKGIGHLLATQPIIPVALLFYFGYPLGLAHFAVLPSFSVARAARQGALFGLFAYGTYDLTNWSTMKDWPAQIALMDMAWGALASALAALVSAWVLRRWQ
jgi:uncharacterized membrane protein